MIIFPVFGSPKQTQATAQAAETQADAKPMLGWRICPVTHRPVMVWTLAEPHIEALPAAACG